ncbi:hypothetical protein [Streptomyces sp. RLB3-6]|uniref:hypothetical protein n=1 Tax=Streptomyces sp. RLB3-6 TaxID=2594457 RepID=UPI001967483F|nr:hypothetical protein [Streptomyces sp. RLB3-6]
MDMLPRGDVVARQADRRTVLPHCLTLGYLPERILVAGRDVVPSRHGVAAIDKHRRIVPDGVHDESHVGMWLRR